MTRKTLAYLALALLAALALATPAPATIAATAIEYGLVPAL